MTCPTPGASCIPLRWRPQPPAHPDGLHTTDSSTGRARTRAEQVPGQTMPRTDTHAQTLGTLRRVSETEQIRTHTQYSNTAQKPNTKKCAMLHVQLDMNTKKCYYNARNERTLKSVPYLQTTTKQEDKNHEVRI